MRTESMRIDVAALGRKDLARARSRKHLWAEAIRFLRLRIPEEAREQIRNLWAENPTGWWMGAHLAGGMSVRNLLREGGFGEREFRISNLDNIYVPLMEEAVGVGDPVRL